MNAQAKRGIAAMVLAFCVVAAACLLAVGRLAPQTFAPLLWLTLIVLIVGLVAIAVVTLRRTKS